MDSFEEIKRKIDKHSPQSRELDVNSEDRRTLRKEVIQYTEEFLSDLTEGKAFEEHSGTTISEKWNLETESTSIEEIIPLFKKEMDSQGLNPASGGHLGYIPGGGIYPAALGDYVAAITNHYAGVHFAGPAAVEIENYLIGWLGKAINFSENARGNLTSGGSIANLIAVVAARDHHNVMRENPRDYCIYLSSQSHHSIDKAIRIAGLEYCSVRHIEVDDHFRINAEHFNQLVKEDLAQGKKPFLCVANIGTTDTGAVDPVQEIHNICKEHNLWLHLDAAYGGFFTMVKEDVEVSLNNLHLADSITVDPHKGLFLPYGSGACLFKGDADLTSSFHYTAGYMQDAQASGTISPADVSPELTKHFRGLRLWLPLKLLGIDRFKAALSEKLWLCRYFYHKIQELGFEVGPYPDLSVMIYRYTDTDNNHNTFNKTLVKALHRDGDVFVSSTTLDGEIWLRLAVLSFRTHKETIDRLLAMIKRSIKKIK